MSIYVNPTQFAAHEDFGRYPRTREADRAALASKGVDVVFEPETLYHRGSSGGGGGVGTGGGDNAHVIGAAAADADGEGEDANGDDAHDTFVTVEHLSRGLCSLSRPHFFRGVATVVAKLFNIVEPDVAAFGEKDWQQLAIVRRMARDLDFAVDVVGGEIVREGDGLALSSRNELLTAEDRAKAPCIYAALLAGKDLARKGKVVGGGGGEEQQKQHATSSSDVAALVSSLISRGGATSVDYVSCVDADSLSPVPAEITVESRRERGRRTLVAVAAFFGKVRLIDNIVL